MVFFRATRSDAKRDVRKGKALPARRFESVRRHSQERFRTCPSLGGLDRIETVIQDETGKKGGIDILPDARPVWELVIPLSRRCNPSPSTALRILRPASRMMAHARSSPGSVFIGNSRMKLAVCLRAMAQETTRRFARLQAACGNRPSGPCAPNPRHECRGTSRFLVIFLAG
jgi:hypothetical protein